MANEMVTNIIGIGVITALIFGGIFVLLSVDTVDESHRGVMVRFGKVIGTMNPGIRWTGFLTHVYQYNMRTRRMEIDLTGDNAAVDQDGQKIIAKIAVNYRVKDNPETIKSLYANIGEDRVIAERLNIPEIITEGFKQTTVKFDALDIVNERQEVKELAKQNIHNNFPKDYFVIEQIVITNIDWSPAFKAEIEAKKVAEQEKLKEENKLQVVILQQQQEIEKYKAETELIRLQSQTLTDLTIKQKMLDKWTGELPQYLIMTEDSQGMFLQLARGDLQTKVVG